MQFRETVNMIGTWNMSSVLGLMSVKCYRDLELGRAIGIENTDVENGHL